MLHGGDTLSYKEYYDGELLDFSSNINPLGPPEGLNEELIKGFESLQVYPDIHYRKLKRSIANYLDCEIENVLVGNGAMELIDNFIMLADRLVTTKPAFAEYSLRAKAHKKEVIELDYQEDFSLDMEAIEGVLKEGDMLVLGSPNNPTGLRIREENLMELYRLVKKRQAYLLLDEAFFEFAPYDYDSIELFKENNYENVGIIRAATKFFGLPGIRLGYGTASKEMVEAIREIELPWTINALADIAGQFIFENKDYIEESRDYINKERDYLLKELELMDWIRPYETHSNYILIKLLDYDEDYIFDYFVRRGIVIRKCSSFEILGKNHIRVAIKDRESNKKLLAVFKSFEKEEINEDYNDNSRIK